MRCARYLLIAFALCLLGVTGRADDEETLVNAFEDARPKIVRDLRERDTAARVAAVNSLAEYPVVESAKLLIPLLASADGPLRRASFECLVKMTSTDAVSEHLQELAAKQWKQAKPSAEAFGVLAALLAANSPEIQQAAADLVVLATGRSEHARAAAIDLIDQLGTGGGDLACRALEELAASPRCEADFAFRRAIGQSLARLRTKSAVTALVKMLVGVQGEVKADIVSYLTEISGENLGADAEHWAAWWQDKQSTFEFPPLKEQSALPGLAAFLGQPPANTPSYYGLPLTASKIVFVIDASGSMQGPRIVAAKRELAKAVEALPAATRFNIVAFHTRAIAWQTKLLPASEENKRNALYFLAAQPLGNKTASYDALEAALRLDAEAMYFLTDGNPTAGKIVAPPQIVTAITQQNRYRRLTINSIGIGVSSPAFESFLATLARQNYGRFERVDQ